MSLSAIIFFNRKCSKMKQKNDLDKKIEDMIKSNLYYPREIAKKLNVPVKNVYYTRQKICKSKKKEQDAAESTKTAKFCPFVSESDKYPTFGIDLKGNDLIRYWQVRAFRESCKSPHFPTRSERNAFNRKFDTNL